MSKQKNLDSDFSFFANDWLQKGPVKAKKKSKKPTKANNKNKNGIQGTKFVPSFPAQAAFLKEYRTTRKISQVALGYEFGFLDTQTARQAVSDIERGKRPLLIQHAINLASLDFAEFAKAYLLDAEANFVNRLTSYGAFRE